MSNINAKCQEYDFAACVKIRERDEKRTIWMPWNWAWRK